MSVPSHSDKYDDFELYILECALEAGMSWEKATQELDDYNLGDPSQNTARIREVIRDIMLHMAEVNE